MACWHRYTYNCHRGVTSYCTHMAYSSTLLLIKILHFTYTVSPNISRFRCREKRLKLMMIKLKHLYRINLIIQFEYTRKSIAFYCGELINLSLIID